MEVGQAVALGAADTGVAIRAAAIAADLDFVPLAEERFDLVFTPGAAADPRLARLLDTLAGPAFRRELEGFGGYDAGETGHVVEGAA
jgi:molybdate-binding protein